MGHAFDGTRQLTFGPDSDSQPALSPDRRRLVFIRERGGEANVALLDLASGPVTPVTGNAAPKESPVFAADGASILYAERRRGDWGIYRVSAAGGLAMPLVDAAGSDERDPEPSADGTMLFFASNRGGGKLDIYRAALSPDGSAGDWQRLTDDPADDRWPSVSRSGRAAAFWSGRYQGGAAFLMNADGGWQRRVAMDADYDHLSLAPDASGIVFAGESHGRESIVEFNAGGELAADETVEARGGAVSGPRISGDGRTLVFARSELGSPSHIFAVPYESPLWRIATRGLAASQGSCGWEGGVLAFGWLRAWHATGEARYLDLAQRWIDGCIAVRTPNHVNDGLLGYAAIEVHGERGGAQRLAFARAVAADIIAANPRALNGAFAHERQSKAVWADTLLGVVPFFLDRPSEGGLGDEAIRQVLAHAEYLQDPETGLLRHAWDDDRGEFMSASAWGRGNGWAILAESDALATMPITHPLRAAVLDVYRHHALALIPLQREYGMWSTVVDRPDFYREASATALIAYGLQRGLENGWLTDAEALDAVRAARTGLWRNVAADGEVLRVSDPTWPSPEPDFYNERPSGGLQLYGQGVALLVLSLLDP